MPQAPRTDGDRAQSDLEFLFDQRVACLAGYEATSWFGLLAPAKTPAPVMAKLNASVLEALADPDVRKKMAEQGAEPFGEKPGQFAAFIGSETANWAGSSSNPA